MLILTFFYVVTFVHLPVVDLRSLALAKRCRRGHGGVRGQSRALGVAGCKSCCLGATSHSRETKCLSTKQKCSYSLSGQELWAAWPWHVGLSSVALFHSSSKTPCRKQPCVMVEVARPPSAIQSMRSFCVYFERGCSFADSVLRQTRRTAFGLLGNFWHIASTCAASKMSHRQQSGMFARLHTCLFAASAECRPAKLQHDLLTEEHLGHTYL